MDVDELKANYFERNILVITQDLKEVANKKTLNCTLTGLIAEDLFPDRTTAILGFCILFLKITTDKEAKLILTAEEFRDFNERILEFCYRQLSYLKNNTNAEISTQQNPVKKNLYTKATLLLELKEFEKKYREEANGFIKWFDATMKKRNAYKEKWNKVTYELEYNKSVLTKLSNGDMPHSVSFDRYYLTENNEVKTKPMYIDQKHITEKTLLTEIRRNESDIEGCKYQYEFYTTIINDSMLENRRKEKLAYLASYAVDYLEQGSESIGFNNNRHFSYHMHLVIPSEGALGDKKFAFEEVNFTETNVREFLNEFFSYASESDKILINGKDQVADTKEKLIIKTCKKQKNEIVKETYEKTSLSRMNKNKTKTELLNIVARKLNMSFEAAKYNYYFKPKKLGK